MPRYQYACRDCGQGFEKKLPMSQASEPQICASCGSEDTYKIFGMVALGSASRSSSNQPPRPVSSPYS